ncbi:hypothetical protein Ddc_20283 [Ditylenchus destructor]|nr:hypothetical protein Ddc_20283 [Ditylenchus destructor]
MQKTDFENENKRRRARRLKFTLTKKANFVWKNALFCLREIATQLGIFSVFCAGQYFGNYPLFSDIKCYANDTCAVQKNGALKISFKDYLSFATKLHTNLEKRLTKLDTSMESPSLEVRQLTYHYESEAIEMAIEHYLDLKQYNVDRRTMPRKVGNVLPHPSFCVPLILGVPLNFIFFIIWAAAEGSVWQVFQFFRVDSTDNFKTDDDD